MRKLWLGMEYKDGALVWTEGTSVGWTNWDKGREQQTNWDKCREQQTNWDKGREQWTNWNKGMEQ